MPTALITGSSQGLGLELVHRLLDAEWNVHGFARGPQELKHERFVAHAVDVADDAAVRAAVAVISAAGSIDLLVNNAGTASMNAFLLTPAATAERLMRVNYLGTFHCLQAVGKVMVRQRAGRIVNITTVAVPLNLEGEAAYVASKAAVEALTRVAGAELAPSGVLVTAVGFGPLDTALTRGVPRSKLEDLNERIGLLKSPTPSEAAYYVLTHVHRAMSGQVSYYGKLPEPRP
jgi:3-oxoacyl-[acyl-carrier protein] reductase